MAISITSTSRSTDIINFIIIQTILLTPNLYHNFRRRVHTNSQVICFQIRRSHPKLTPPHVIYLCGNSFVNSNGANVLPPLPALQASYKKLVDLCTPTTLAGFWVRRVLS